MHTCTTLSAADASPAIVAAAVPDALAQRASGVSRWRRPPAASCAEVFAELTRSESEGACRQGRSPPPIIWLVRVVICAPLTMTVPPVRVPVPSKSNADCAVTSIVPPAMVRSPLLSNASVSLDLMPSPAASIVIVPPLMVSESLSRMPVVGAGHGDRARLDRQVVLADDPVGELGGDGQCSRAGDDQIVGGVDGTVDLLIAAGGGVGHPSSVSSTSVTTRGRTPSEASGEPEIRGCSGIVRPDR